LGDMIIVLEAVFDDSDIMTDYFHRDRGFQEWYICDLEGKMVTEAKLRKAWKQLPAWLKAFKWSFRKGEKYSMSDHYYGQLRADEGTGLEIKGEFTYSHDDKPVRFILTATHLETFKMNHSVEDPTPQTIQEMRQIIEGKQRKWREQREQTREHMKKAYPRIIQDSYAIINGEGFRVLTQENKDELVADFKAKMEREDRERKRD